MYFQNSYQNHAGKDFHLIEPRGGILGPIWQKNKNVIKYKVVHTSQLSNLKDLDAYICIDDIAKPHDMLFSFSRYHF